MKSIGIIGGGPVGLMMALLLKNSFDVTVYEQRSEYTRDHSVKINDNIIDLLSAKSGNLNLFEWKNEALTTSKIEIFLKRELEKQVKIVRSKITKNFSKLNHDIIIGSDGSKSATRNFLGIGIEDKEKFGNLLSIKYKTPGCTKPRKPISAFFYWGINSLGFDTENIDFEIMSSKVTQDDKSGTLLIPIDNGAYSELKDANYTKYLTKHDIYSNPKLENISKIIKRYEKISLKWRKGEMKNEKITCIPLEVYRSKITYKEVDKIHYFLVGDSSSGLIYEKGLNKGWEECLILFDTLMSNRYCQYSEKCKELFYTYKNNINFLNGGSVALSVGMKILCIILLLLLIVAAIVVAYLLFWNW